MKVAVLGSRSLVVNHLEHYLPEGTTEIVSGGAKGIDACAKLYAQEKGIKYTEFLPEYEKYKKGAPLKRNLKIIDCADTVIVFWDKKSKGTKHVIDNCIKKNRKLAVFLKDEKFNNQK